MGQCMREGSLKNPNAALISKNTELLEKLISNSSKYSCSDEMLLYIRILVSYSELDEHRKNQRKKG